MTQDSVLFRVNSLLSIAKEAYNAARLELEKKSETASLELGSLYQQLARGEISEAEFDKREHELFTILRALEKNKSHQNLEPV